MLNMFLTLFVSILLLYGIFVNSFFEFFRFFFGVFMNTIGERLKKIRQALSFSQKDFGSCFGSSQNSISKYELNQAEISNIVIDKLVSEFGVNANWLITGHGEMFGENAPSANIARLPVLDASASAGTGIENLSVEIVDEFEISKRVLLPFPDEKCRVIFTRGDSMSPTIQDGEMLIFVLDLIDANGIYIIRSDGRLMVKRVEFQIGKPEMIIKSDNPNYENYTLLLDDTPTVQLLGRVILHLHRPR